MGDWLVCLTTNVARRAQNYIALQGWSSRIWSGHLLWLSDTRPLACSQNPKFTNLSQQPQNYRQPCPKPPTPDPIQGSSQNHSKIAKKNTQKIKGPDNPAASVFDFARIDEFIQYIIQTPTKKYLWWTRKENMTSLLIPSLRMHSPRVIFQDVPANMGEWRLCVNHVGCQWRRKKKKNRGLPTGLVHPWGGREEEKTKKKQVLERGFFRGLPCPCDGAIGPLCHPCEGPERKKKQKKIVFRKCGFVAACLWPLPAWAKTTEKPHFLKRVFFVFASWLRYELPPHKSADGPICGRD